MVSDHWDEPPPPEAVTAFRFIQPCSPVTARSVPAGDAWIHEPKLDGYRLQVVKDGPTVRLCGRRRRLCWGFRGMPGKIFVNCRRDDAARSHRQALGGACRSSITHLRGAQRCGRLRWMGLLRTKASGDDQNYVREEIGTSRRHP